MKQKTASGIKSFSKNITKTINNKKNSNIKDERK